ncbi:MAG: hypothetical protein M1814_005603 [Vezdaea aestivalis]|nr:MAG: hypothetical protein M1814_005603 [Vezdaea aestivalis]
MDVTRWNLRPKLESILQDFADAHFIAFDFEFSGIQQTIKGSGKEKKTLEQRYQEVKAAAEKYTILQAGFTVALKNPKDGSFELKPYNFNISPLFREKWMDIDRPMTIQPGAAEFLLKNGFNFHEPFQSGNLYLSREEEEIVRANMKTSLDRSSIEDMDIGDWDLSTQEFLTSLRSQIDKWEADRIVCPPKSKLNKTYPVHPRRPKTPPPQLTILPHNYPVTKKERREYGDDRDLPTLSPFHRRLTYQTIRNEYPCLTAFSRGGRMIIKQRDDSYEAYIQTRREGEMEDSLLCQIGFRWLIEALCANSEKADPDPKSQSPDVPRTRFDAIPPLHWAVAATGEFVGGDPNIYTPEWDLLRKNLARRPLVLVGHNCFVDLVYLYSTFIGRLPSTVAEFSSAIHRLFPFIIDTKFLATAFPSDPSIPIIRPASSHPSKDKVVSLSDRYGLTFSHNSNLQDNLKALAYLTSPKITTHPSHTKYTGENAPAHEAGYDSMMTGELLIRLSAVLYKLYPTPAPRSLGLAADRATSPAGSIASSETADGGVPLPETLPVQLNGAPTKKGLASSVPIVSEKVDKVEEEDLVYSVNPKLVHANPYALLDLSDDQWSKTESTEGWTKLEIEEKPVSNKEEDEEGETPELLMPAFSHSAFWNYLGNRVRVFGTQEEAMYLF